MLVSEKLDKGPLNAIAYKVPVSNVALENVNMYAFQNMGFNTPPSLIQNTGCLGPHVRTMDVAWDAMKTLHIGTP